MSSCLFGGQALLKPLQHALFFSLRDAMKRKAGRTHHNQEITVHGTFPSLFFMCAFKFVFPGGELKKKGRWSVCDCTDDEGIALLKEMLDQPDLPTVLNGQGGLVAMAGVDRVSIRPQVGALRINGRLRIGKLEL